MISLSVLQNRNRTVILWETEASAEYLFNTNSLFKGKET